MSGIKYHVKYTLLCTLYQIPLKPSVLFFLSVILCRKILSVHFTLRVYKCNQMDPLPSICTLLSYKLIMDTEHFALYLTLQRLAAENISVCVFFKCHQSALCFSCYINKTDTPEMLGKSMNPVFISGT